MKILRMAEPKEIYRNLSRYKKILDGKAKAKFLLAKKSGLLDKAVKKAWENMKSCTLCERACKVNRMDGETGVCGVGDEFRIFGAHTHWGEEPELIPSATLFASGCTMRCTYCQNAPASIEYEAGTPWSFEEAAEWVEQKAAEGCKNVNFVGGDPTPDVPFILETLKRVDANIPVVFNSNAYYSAFTANLLSKLVDVYLLDFRYFNDKCGTRLSAAPNYPEVAKRNHLVASRNSELIIRLLVMPNHVECDAKPILKWIKDALGPETRLNILAQYRPMWKAHKHEDINVPLGMEEYREAVDYAKGIGLNNLCR